MLRKVNILLLGKKATFINKCSTKVNMVAKCGLKKIILSILIIAIFSSLILAEDATTIPEVTTIASETTTTENTNNINTAEINETALNEINITTNETIINETSSVEAKANYNLTSFTPKEFKVGDVQFNIQVQNTGNTELKNLMAFISGKGLSSYDITPIDVLKPGEKSYILMTGNLREEGDIPITIRINDKTFTQVIKVIDPNSGVNNAALKAMQEKETGKKAAVAILSQQFEELNKNYTSLDQDYFNKKKENYDLSGISLEDLKKFLRNAQSSIIAVDSEQANISLTLAFNEYNYQKNKLDQAQKIETSFLDAIKNNVGLLSAIATGIITLFGFYEFVMKKKDTVSEKLKSIKKTEKKEEEKKEEEKKESEHHHEEKKEKK